MALQIDLKQARREMFRVRGRFLKLQRTVVGEALEFASVPVVEAAKANAPIGATGRLRSRIQFINARQKRGLLTVDVGPARFGKGDKLFPFWGRFQEHGWRAMGRASRKTVKHWRAIPGKHFLRRAGEQNFSRVERIFSERVFRGLAEIQAAGEAAGLG